MQQLLKKGARHQSCCIDCSRNLGSIERDLVSFLFMPLLPSNSIITSFFTCVNCGLYVFLCYLVHLLYLGRVRNQVPGGSDK